jgi:hypothetical protein
MIYLIYINKYLIYNNMDNDIENQITNDEIKKICCLSCAVYTSITLLCIFAIHAFYNSFK